MTAAVCVSAIAVRAASPAAVARSPASAPPSSSEEKLIVQRPSLPWISASASFSPSTMSCELPRPGAGSEE